MEYQVINSIRGMGVFVKSRNEWRITAVVLIVCSTVVSPAFGQGDTGDSFDVASVKLITDRCSATAPCNGEMKVTPNGVTFHGYVLGYLIRWAYGLNMYQPYQTVGPDWLEPGGKWSRYDVVAKTDRPVSPEQLRLMLRKLLAERVHLAVHHEKRLMTAYVLTGGSGQRKLSVSESEGDAKIVPPKVSAGADWWWGVWHFEHVEFAKLHELLWTFLPALIVDETGLQGLYDFDLNVGKFQDYYQPPSVGSRADLGPALSHAFQEIGLKLEQKRRPEDVLVIDHAEQVPIGN